MTSEQKTIIDMLEKLKGPSALLNTCITFSAGWLIMELIRLHYWGDPLRETPLMISATFGVISIICWIRIATTINKIKKTFI